MTEYHKVIKLRTGENIVCKCRMQNNDDYYKYNFVEVTRPVVILSHAIYSGDELVESTGFYFKPWVEISNDVSYRIPIENIVTVCALNKSLIDKYEKYIEFNKQENITFASESERLKKEQEESDILKQFMVGSTTIN